MKFEYLSQNSIPSHVQNGNFSQGAAHWFGSFLRHQKILGSGTASMQPGDSRATPEYGIEVNCTDDSFFPDGIRPGINQFIDRSDTYRYPSRRRAGGVELIPYSTERAILKVMKGGSTLDGQIVDDLPSYQGTPTYSDYFQHPFVYRDGDDVVSVTPASELEWIDDIDKTRTKIYKAHRTLYNYDGYSITGGAYTGPGDVLPGPTPIASHAINRFSYHSLVIAPASGDAFQPEVTSDNPSFERLVFKGAPLAHYIDVEGDLDAILPLIRQGYIIQSAAPELFSMEIYQVKDMRQDPVAPTDVIRLMVRALKAYNLIIAAIGQTVDTEITSWNIFKPTVGTATVEKDLIVYDYTLASTYKISQGYQRPIPTLQFYTVDFAARETNGFGLPGEVIPQVGATQTTYFPTKQTNDVGITNLIADPTWRRDLVRFYREARRPIDGRLLLNLKTATKGPELAAGPLTPYQFVYNNLPSDPHVQIYMYGTISDSTLFTSMVIEKSFPTETATVSWVDKFIRGAGPDNFNSLAVANIQQLVTLPSAPAAAVAKIAVNPADILPPDPDHPYNYTIPPLGVTGHERYAAYRLIDKGVAIISDVCLYPGDYTQKFEFVELAGAADSLQRINFSNHMLDELKHSTNEYEGALPRGAVVLYTGGHVCPPGFKRLDGLPRATSAGIGYGEIQGPDNIEYLPETDRTVLTWNSLYLPVKDKRGNPILLRDFTTAYDVVYNGKFLNFGDEPAELQATQPSLSLRANEIAYERESSQNPLYFDQTRGAAVRFSSNLPGLVGGDSVLGRIEIDPHPNYTTFDQSMAIEMWFKFNQPIDAAANDLTEQAFLYRRMQITGKTANGYDQQAGIEIIVRRDYSVLFRLWGGDPTGANTYNGTYTRLRIHAKGPTWDVSTVDPSLPTHLVARIEREGNSATISLWLRQAGGVAEFTKIAQTLDLGSGAITETESIFDSYFVNQKTYLGRPPASSIGNVYTPGALSIDMQSGPVTGTLFSLDSFRIFENLSNADVDTLWNNGAGIFSLPPPLFARQRAAFHFDTYGQYLVPNGAKNNFNTPLPYARILSGETSSGSITIAITRVDWVVGHLIGRLTSTLSSASYYAPYDKLAPSHMITNLEVGAVDTAIVNPSAKAWQSNESEFGSGFGTAAYPVVVTEEEITAATGETRANGISTIPPVGDIVNKVNQFTFNGIDGTVTGTAEYVSGNKEEIAISIPSSNFNDQFKSQLRVGDVYQLTWDYPTAAAATTHICRYLGSFDRRETVVVNNVNTYVYSKMYRFNRYDNQKFKANLPSNTTFYGLLGSTWWGQWGKKNAGNLYTINAPAVIRPATLFGRGAQIYDKETRQFTFPGVRVKYFPGVTPTNKGVWAFAPAEPATRITVQGKFTPNPLAPLFLEPSGYLRYDNPGMDFGGGGHSHKILQSTDDISVDNLVPRINPDGAYANLARTRVASEHHHGNLPVYRYPLPKFKLFGLCEKL